MSRKLARQFTVGGRIPVRLVFSCTSLDSADTLHTINNIFSSLVKSNLVKLETSSPPWFFGLVTSAIFQ